MKFSKQYPTDRFYAADFKGKPRTLTFRAKEPVTMELLGKGSSSEKTLPVWHFADEPLKFPAVKTNGVCARAMFGDESDDWAGRKITLYPAPDASGLSDDGLCVRVKGSPELPSKLVFTAQIGRTKKTFTLVPTGNAKTDARAGLPEDDIGFTDEAPHAHENNVGPAGDDLGPDGYTEAVEADYAPDGEIPGIGVEEVKARKRAS